jgi:TonB-linked SusC/RagA family outer membrane protein
MRRFLFLLGPFSLLSIMFPARGNVFQTFSPAAIAHRAAVPPIAALRCLVLDDHGQAVPFASIRFIGKKGGAIADEDGWFTIRIAKGDSLLISGTGIRDTAYRMADLRPSPPGTLLIRVIRKPGMLSQIVITPFGLPREKTRISYAVQEITQDEWDKVPTLNITDNLAGKVAGLQVTSENTMGGSANVILRGLKSLTQSNQALFVVDGIPIDNTNHSIGGYDLGNGAADINPEDIASIHVLKGAEASALYGSRGANGAIMITTGRGAGGGTSVSAAVDVTVGSPDRGTLPTYQTQYGQGHGNAFFSQAVPGVNGGTPVLIVQTPYDAATGPAYQSALMVYNWDAFSPSDRNYHRATPWQPAARHNPVDFFVTPVMWRESIFVQGAAGVFGAGAPGAEGTRTPGAFKMGFTHADDKDLLPNSRLEKNMLTLSASRPLSARMTIGGTLNYVQTQGRGRYLYPYTGTSGIMTTFREWWPANIDLRSLKDDYRKSLTNATWNWQRAAYSGNLPGPTPRLDVIGLPAYHDNPYWERYQNYEQDMRNRYYGNVFCDYRVSGGLTIRADVTADTYTQLTEQRNNTGSQELSFYDRYNQTYGETNYDLYVDADKHLGAGLEGRVLLGGNIRRDNNQSIEARTNGGLVVPGLYALSNGAAAPLSPAETDFKKAADALFVEATLSYKNLYTVTATLRRDRSSALSADNDTWYYPSLTANMILSGLIPRARWYAKLWAGYAGAGNDPATYALYNTYAAGAPFNDNPVYAASSVNKNPHLEPELDKTGEAGLETRLWQDKIGFTVVCYRSVQMRQIMPASVSRASGFNAFYINAGDVRNQGLELYLHTLVKAGSFSWNASVNWSANSNKVLSLYNDQPSYEINGFQNAVQLVAEQGKAYGELRGTDYVYGPGGARKIDAAGRYMIAANTASDIGNINPKWVGSLTNKVSYKGLSFCFLVDVRKGGQLYSLDMDYGSSSGLYPRTAGRNDLGNPVRAPLAQGGGIILKGVLADGKTPNARRIDESDISTGNYSFGSEWGEADRSFVYDASYIKLREVSLTYALPRRRAKVVSGVEFALSGRNLWLIHKNEPYADPEQGQASGNASVGFQSGAYPAVRQLAVSIKWTR